MHGVHHDVTVLTNECLSTQSALWLLASASGLYRKPFHAYFPTKEFLLFRHMASSLSVFHFIFFIKINKLRALHKARVSRLSSVNLR